LHGKEAPSRAAFRIDEWLCEPELNRISGRGALCQVEPKVMQVLVMLAQAEGRLVLRDELLSVVWAGTFGG